jgi:hypothetical protein
MEQTKQLVIGGAKARELYPTADAIWKASFEETFGKDFFSLKPTDRIKTVDDACAVLGINPAAWSLLYEPDELADKKLNVVIKALNFLENGNKVWVPDYNNTSERKWLPYFWMNKPGFRLGGVVCDRTYSDVGARRVFKTEELARYAATHFSGLYSDCFEIQSEKVSNGVAAPLHSFTDFKDIKTFEDACKVKGYDPVKAIPNVLAYPENHQAALTGMAKLFIINEAINYVDNGNQDWEPDYDDGDEEKYYPWADMEVDSNNPSGFRLVDVGYDDTGSYVGARLSYKSENGARHGFTQFEAIYRDVFKLK